MPVLKLKPVKSQGRRKAHGMEVEFLRHSATKALSGFLQIPVKYCKATDVFPDVSELSELLFLKGNSTNRASTRIRNVVFLRMARDASENPKTPDSLKDSLPRWVCISVETIPPTTTIRGKTT